MRLPVACTALIFTIATAAIAGEVPKSIAGPALVVDGDGLRIGEWEIRLLGIDAPELRDGTKGLRSRDELQELIAKRVVECDGQYFDRYDRVVAICRVDGRDLGEDMLSIGWAKAWPKYLEGNPVKDAYLKAERKGRAAKLGLWAD
jgi:endonuclease YncB( thermonuclease family)